MKQNERVTGKEQYYTPAETADELVSIMLNFASVDNHWMEPAGGTGSFVDAMKRQNIQSITSYDIEPLHPEVLQTNDFLEENLDKFDGCISLSNPPFGRANKLSVPFFNKCATVSSKIGFLVPKSWRKWSVINRLDQRFHLIYDQELFVNFIRADSQRKSSNKLATIFQVWEKRDHNRTKIIIEDRGYIRKVLPCVADVSLTAFGRGCGHVKLNFLPVANTTQMFLKASRPWVIDALFNIDYAKFCNNVAFVEALSIQEINFLLNEYADAQGLD
jgi:hypothetical protein